MPTTVMSEGRSLGTAYDDGGDELKIVPEDDLAAPASPRHGHYIVDPISCLAPPGYLGTRQEIEEELDVVAAALRRFHMQMPDQRMREIAAYSARLTELCVLLHRVESTDRQYIRVRTQQVERFLTELDRQYKIASRMVEVSRQDLELMK